MSDGIDVEAIVACLERVQIYGAKVTANEISIGRAGGRNDNVVVRRRGSSSFLIKRSPPECTDHALENEAAFCTYCQERDGFRGLREVVPRVAATDRVEGAFIYEMIEPTVLLWDFYEATPGRGRIAAGADLGRCLALFHNECAPLLGGTTLSWLPQAAPPPFAIHRPSPRDLRDMSTGTHALISILQQRAVLCSELDRLRTGWTSTSVIHGDIRSDNVLVSVAKTNLGPRVHIVDFETVQIGDPAWDLGGAFQDAVLFWLCSMSPGTDVREMSASAKHSLDEVRALCRAIVNGYTSSSSVGGAFVQRAVRYSAVRMLQSAYEFSYEASGLPWQAVLLMQLAENLLADPDRTSEDFYGLAIA